MITYKGYTALLEVDVPSGEIVGHVIGIRDEVVFTGKTTEETIAGFHQAVDFYLGRLAEAGQEPERPFSGRFNVRIEPEIHRRLVLDAEARKVSLNDVVKRALAAYLDADALRDQGTDLVTPISEERVTYQVKQGHPRERTPKGGTKRAPSKSGT